MELIIVESPNKKSTIKSFLPNKFVVEASVGHIRQIRDSGYSNSGIDPQNHFRIDFEVSPDKKDVVKQLKNLVRMSDMVYLASDEDREGEAIAWHLKKVLGLKEGKFKRVTFNEITKTEVLKGLANPREIDDNLVRAAFARSAIDKLMGYRLSPIIITKTKGRSAGRVQSAALKILCDREREIIAFVPHTYYDLKLHFIRNGNEYKAVLKTIDGKKVEEITSRDLALSIISACHGNTYFVSNIRINERKMPSVIPFTTSSLLQEASSKLHIPTEEATRCAQRLFEGIEIDKEHSGLITYIRTDSTRMDEEFKQNLYGYITNVYGKEYKGFVKEAKSKSKEQGAHECIRVVNLGLTPEKVEAFLPDRNCARIYKLIYNRTIASAMSDAKVHDEIVTISNGPYDFEIKGTFIDFDGWLKSYPYKGDEDDEESFPPNLKRGDIIQEKELELLEKQSQPPKRYSEAKLVKAMEDYGIGRPSTYPAVIKVLKDKDRNYTTKGDGNTLIPTDIGMNVSQYLDENFGDMINLQYTSEMENELDLIAEGDAEYEEILNKFFAQLVREADSIMPPKEQAQEVGRKCPKCGKPLVVRKNQKGEKFIGCSNYPNCKYIESFNSYMNGPQYTEKRCPVCNGKIVKRFNRQGEPFYACGNFPRCRKTFTEEEFKDLK